MDIITILARRHLAVWAPAGRNTGRRGRGGRGWAAGLLAMMLLSAGASQVLAQAILPAGFTETRVEGISSPTAMAVAPDGRVFVCEQRGAVRVVKGGVLLRDPFATLTVHAFQERGLVGIQFDPDFAVNRHVYVYYTAVTPTIHNRLSRLTADGDVAVPGSEVVLLDLPTLGESGWHNGGSMVFGPAGRLYVGVGENNIAANAQSLDTPLGKILRINRDGSIPADNPFFDSTTGLNRAIWALGFRNPFTMSFKPGTDRLFVNDVGFDSYEEINEVVRGRNYGWPIHEGPSSDPNFVSPVYAYTHPLVAPVSSAITGGAFYNPATNQFPVEFLGKYLFMDGFTQVINVLDTATGTVSPFASFPPFTGDGPDVVPLYLTVANDGSVYYLARGKRALNRIQYTGVLSPQIGTQPADLVVSVGQPAVFAVSAFGASPLAFQWERRNAGAENFVPVSGATSATLTLATTEAGDNDAQFRCVLSNPVGSVTTTAAALTVTANLPPVASILAPVPGTTYRAGNTIQFSGTGSDPETGLLDASAMTWRVEFQHHEHNHPFLTELIGVSGGSFVIPAVGETSDDVWYRIYLTVTDPVGLKHTTFRDIFPVKAQVTLATVPPGLQLTLDGTPVTGPFGFVGVAGVLREISAGHQVLGGVTYEFLGWSDGGNATHVIRTPPAATTLTANFRVVENAIDDAAFISESHEPLMVAGQSYNVRVTMKNVGTTTWNSSNGYFLASQNPPDSTNWNVVRVELPGDVLPGASTTFSFKVVAPELPGTYPMQWQMIHDGVAFFGSLTPSVPIGVTVAPNAARFIGQVVPTNMIAGETYTAVIEMKNVGSQTWTAQLRHRLGSQNPQDNSAFGLARVQLPDSVPPGQISVFSFPVVAPLTPGAYNFQWQMGQEAGDAIGRFGDLTENFVVTVVPLGNDALFVSQEVPTTMLPSQTYTVTVVMRNIGTNAWRAADGYRLGSQNPLDNFFWGRARALLSADVPPGQDGEFRFSVLAPSEPGNYAFQWQMLQEGVELFGRPSSNQVVRVLQRSDDSAFVTESVPPGVVPGQTYGVSISFRNTGTSTWNPATHRLTSVNPTGNTVWGRDTFALAGPVGPGQTAVFSGDVTGPDLTGNAAFQWQMMSDGAGLFGQVTPNIPISVLPRPNNAAFVSQSVPAEMVPGQEYDVQVVLRNTGSNPWTSETFHNLSSQNPLDNTFWGTPRVALNGAVSPGSNATFNFRVVAPTQPGNYNFQWRMVQEGTEFFGDSTPNVLVTVGTANSDALILSSAAPASVDAGAVFNAVVRVRNTGTTSWTPAAGYVLATQNPAENQRWGLSRALLPGTVLPGGEVTFNIQLTAPAVAGTYDLQWQMLRVGGGFFGTLAENLRINVTAPTTGANNAAFGSQNVPATMDPNQIYIVSVTMTNTGTTEWTGNQLYRLGAQRPANNLVWAVNRVGLPTASIPAGATATFDFQVLSPATAGVYDFQWQMVQDGVGYFGALTPNVRVTVGDPADQAVFVDQAVPAGLRVDQAFSATLRFRNQGGQTWTPEAGYQLGSQNPADNLLWGTNRFALVAPVAPGEIAEFTLPLKAPADAGAYNFQWRMFREGAGYFGETGSNLVVNVAPVAATVNDAVFVSQNIPATMVVGLSYPISITLSNSGSANWTRERLYRLASANPIDNLRFNVNRVLLPAPTSAGGLVTFTFNVTAPQATGEYDCQWRMVQEAVAFFGATTPNVRVSVVPQGSSSVFVSQSVPTAVVTGQVFTARVTMRNNGIDTWTPAGQFKLRTENPADTTIWGPNRALLSGPVAPGEEVAFNVELVAPRTPGVYNLQWQMIREGTGPFGAVTPNLAINVTTSTLAPHDAAFVSQNVPAAMNPGQIYIASITMANTGTTAWTTDQLFRLGSQNPTGNLLWSVNRVGLPGTIAPGATATFDFQVLAPATPGAYNFQWQMVLDGGVGFFGSPTKNLTIIVGQPGDNAEFVRQEVPLTVTNSQTFAVKVVLRNSGGSTWVSDAGYQLGSQGPADNLTWGFNRTPLPSVVVPGATAEFTFQLTAPAEPGNYDFQWQMRREGFGFFGQSSPRLSILVTPPVEPTDGAAFGAQSVPVSMLPGETYPVSITLTNTGTTTWTADALYRLASQNPIDNLTWGINRIGLPGAILPGGVAQFDFSVTAPRDPGTYKFQWQMVREGVAFFGDQSPEVTVVVSGRINAAAFVSQRVPSVMQKGQRYPVTITMRNVGDSTWTRETAFRLGSQNPEDTLLFGVNRVGITTPVVPGGTVTFNFIVTPPDNGGVHNFQWQMVQERVGFFGERTPNVPVTVLTTDGLSNQAAFVSQSVPSNLVAGATVPVAVTFRNNGTNVWTVADRFKLGSQNPADNSVWNVNRVQLPRTVLPGENVTFNFNIRAPRTAGRYNFQWQMLQEGVGWFGQASANLPLTVGTLAPPVITSDPVNRIVTLGEPASFSVVATGAAPLGYQWMRNNAPIGGATAATYSIFRTVAADNGAQFRCVVTNLVGTALSATAVLTVAGPDAPVVTSILPEAGSTTALINTSVRAVFSQEMDAGSINGSTFRLVPEGSSTAVEALVSYDAGTRTASLIPTRTLNPGATYSVRIAGGTGGVRSQGGVPMAAAVTWNFTTLDTRGLTVVAIAPTNGTRQVVLNSPVRITFNKAVDPASINGTTFTVTRKGATTPVPGNVTYDAATRTATFTPTVSMLANWTYNVVVLGGPQGVRDLSGIVMASSATSVFYTTDTQAPRFLNVTVSGITSTSVTINWDTNENSDSQVRYGLTTAMESATALNPALVLTHSVTLTGLLPNRTYHYQVRSRDGFGNQGATATDLVFTTAP